jgi:hypothetical protein
MTTSDGRETVKYLVRCALPAGQSIIKKDQYGASYTFSGQIGVAPAWADGACDLACQENVSACMLAHVNTTGQNVSLWLDGNAPAIGWGQSTNHPYQEGSFFGNIFTDPPTAYFCNGQDFDQGVVPGRLGANQLDAPYLNPFAAIGGDCKRYCTAQDIPNQNDGYKACHGFNHVITVWRNFDPGTAYKICNKASGKCLDSAGSLTEGAKIVQKGYTSAASQKWNIIQVSPKRYRVVNVSSKKTLDVYAKLTANGTAIIQSTYNGATNQLWSFTSMANGSGLLQISTALNANVLLAVPSSGLNTEGQAVQEWARTTSDSMKWTLGLAN